MSDDLVKRLRDRGVCSLAHNSCRNDMACEQAANRIEALEAERDMLRDALAGTESIILFQQAQLKAYEEMAPPRDPDLLRKRLDEIKARKEY